MKKLTLIPLVTILASCASMNESLILGATMGAATGAAATSAAHGAHGNSASSGDIAVSAGIGLAVGLLTSYLVHKDVAEKRGDLYSSSPEIHFGDLPPSPFIMSPMIKKKGVR